MAVFGPSILSILGGTKSFATNMSENDLRHLVYIVLFVGDSIKWIRKAKRFLFKIADSLHSKNRMSTRPANSFFQKENNLIKNILMHHHSDVFFKIVKISVEVALSEMTSCPPSWPRPHPACSPLLHLPPPGRSCHRGRPRLPQPRHLPSSQAPCTRRDPFPPSQPRNLTSGQRKLVCPAAPLPLS